MHQRIVRFALAAIFIAALTPRVGAWAATDEFYRGKVIRVVVGFSAGGGFDTYARLVARYLGNYVPGRPSMVVENMTGAGSLIAANHVYKVARPDVDRILNVRPAIAIEQKNQVRTARSTVGTATEIADLLRLLFAKIGRPICPDCHEEARAFYPDTVASDLLDRFPDARAMLLFPLTPPSAKTELALVQSLLTRGFTKVRSGDEIVDLRLHLVL